MRCSTLSSSLTPISRPKRSNSQKKSSETELVRCPPCKTNFGPNHAFLRNPRVLDPKIHLQVLHQRRVRQHLTLCLRISHFVRVAKSTFIINTFATTWSDSTLMEQKVRLNSNPHTSRYTPGKKFLARAGFGGGSKT